MRRPSKAATDRMLKTYGEGPISHRIDARSFAQWRIEQRDADLDDADAQLKPRHRKRLADGY